MAAIAQSLPYDIFCLIFEYYAESECYSERLEGLLLVCKSWRDAAQSYGRLWSTFDIQIETLKDSASWTSRFGRRLARCSAGALLNIDINTSYEMKMERSCSFIDACKRLLVTLTGAFGEIAARWRRFFPNDAFRLLPSRLLARSLSFPTPKLEEIWGKINGAEGDYIILAAVGNSTWHAWE